MRRIQWCLPAVPAMLLAACGTGDASSAEPNRATSIAPPSVSTSGAPAGGDWTMPTGVFRAERPQGLLELHVDPGTLHLYDVTGGTPEVAYAADCVTDDPSTVTCTERDGFQLVIAWSGTGDAVELTLPGAASNHRAVWEGTPWTRVP
jgi:hypothetical protein